MKNSIALITILLWPVIPLMWIPVHVATAFFRRLGRTTYLFVSISWMAIAYFLLLHRCFILAHRLDIPTLLSISGLIILVAGTFLHIWTASLLTFLGITGIHQIAEPQKSKLVEKGPFAIVRHPTYLAHTIMFLGIFLFTGFISVGILTIADFIIVNTLIIPLEERELLQRFGTDYREYMKKVPRLIPRRPQKT